jgi:hypothetical protein
MSDVLVGTPDLISRWLKARYEPLRDSRANSEPEKHQRKLLKGTGYLLMVGGLSLEILLVAMHQISVAPVLFGLAVAALGLKFLQMAKAPLKFQPPEPLENLVALSQGLGLCRALDEAFPTMRIEMDPINFVVTGSCDGYDWQVTVDREGLKPMPKDELGYETYTAVSEAADSQPAAGRVWRRTDDTANRHRIFWVVSVAGDFNPRPGQPSQHTSLESKNKDSQDKTECVFTLPINQPDQPGLGHEGRTDYISSPVGLHHPEFVGEQIAQSLVWMFKPR